MPARPIPLLIALLVPLAGCGPSRDGAGEASPLFGKALAALRSGDLAGAEAAADGAAAKGGPEYAALRDFLRGNVAFARCDAAESESFRNPGAFERALAMAELARDSWQRAAVTRPDWPEARRNVERALLRIRRLRNDRDAADRAKGRPPGAPPKAVPPPTEDGSKPADLPGSGAARPLSREEVLGLLDRLAAMDREKVAGRRALREKRQGDAERDW